MANFYFVVNHISDNVELLSGNLHRKSIADVASELEESYPPTTYWLLICNIELWLQRYDERAQLVRAHAEFSDILKRVLARQP